MRRTMRTKVHEDGDEEVQSVAFHLRKQWRSAHLFVSFRRRMTHHNSTMPQYSTKSTLWNTFPIHLCSRVLKL